MDGLSIREMEHHMDVDMFLDGYAGWEVEAPIAPSSSMKCSYMPQSRGRKRQNECSARAINMAS